MTKRATKDTDLDGYFIPKDTVVMVSLSFFIFFLLMCHVALAHAQCTEVIAKLQCSLIHQSLVAQNLKLQSDNYVPTATSVPCHAGSCIGRNVVISEEGCQAFPSYSPIT